MATDYRLPLNERSSIQWSRYELQPKERRMNAIAENVTIFGEAPSNSHEIDFAWIIWKETRDDTGRIFREYAQEGSNRLQWIYNEIAFDPQPDQSGAPYGIILDNNIVYDGMSAGMPVANISALDIDDTFHIFELTYDGSNHFDISGSVLFLTDDVQLSDIAYGIRIKATDDDGNSIVVPFAIYVEPVVAPPSAATGEINLYDEDILNPNIATTVFDYTVPASRILNLRLIDCFGENPAEYEVLIDGARAAYKRTYWTSYETKFDFDELKVLAGQNIKVNITNKGTDSTLHNARVRGYQYAT
jgi:hypothetical protein